MSRIVAAVRSLSSRAFPSMGNVAAWSMACFIPAMPAVAAVQSVYDQAVIRQFYPLRKLFAVPLGDLMGQMGEDGPPRPDPLWLRSARPLHLHR